MPETITLVKIEALTQIRADTVAANVAAVTPIKLAAEAARDEAVLAASGTWGKLKTANYSASHSDIVLCDSTAGSFNIILPNPVVGAHVTVVDAGNAFGTNAVWIYKSTGAIVAILTVSGMEQKFFCYATPSGGSWRRGQPNATQTLLASPVRSFSNVAAALGQLDVDLAAQEAAAAGFQPLDLNTDMVQGREYLYAWYEKLRARTAAKIVMSGDSTTGGTSCTTPYRMWEIIPAMGDKLGHTAITTVNRGQSGVTPLGWTTTYLAGDLAEVPDLLTCRWGMNPDAGATTDATRAAATIATIRAGLTTIRAARSVAQTSIVLMMVNSATDDAAFRTTAYMQAVRAGLRIAAKDFKCAFFDTYKLLLDSSFGGWINEDSPGVFVHPLNMGNLIIADQLGALLFPVSINLSAAPSALTLLNSWTNWGSGVGGTVKYRRTAEGMIQLSGVCKNGTFSGGSALLATLPSGFRPFSQKWVTVPCAAAAGNANMLYATIVIETDGDVIVYNAPGNYYLSLDNIQFSSVE